MAFAVTTGGLLLAGTGHASAAGVMGSGGVLSGNSVQIPIQVPLNLCGNSVLAVAAAHSSGDTDCSIGAASGSYSGMAASSTTSSGAASNSTVSNSAVSNSTVSNSTVSNSAASSGAVSNSAASSSSGSTAVSDMTGADAGLASGNVAQIPITVPANVCGNLISILGVLDSSGSTSCAQNIAAPPSPTPSASSSSYPSPAPTPTSSPSSSVSMSTSQISQGANGPAPVGAAQPLTPAGPMTADPVIVWPRPDSPQHVNMPLRPLPAKVTCDVAPAAHTEALGGVSGGALSTAGATAAAFISGTGLRVLGRRRRRRH